MKKAIFFVQSCSTTKLNEFETCRGEGRIIMNVAFGFSLLNYECYIVNNWNIKEPKQIWNNVYIIKTPDKNTIYDIAFTFDQPSVLNEENYIHKISMSYLHFEEVLQYSMENNMKCILVCPIPSFMSIPIVRDYAQYLPALFPIPSIHIGFVPYKFEPTLPNLKVYVYNSSWENYNIKNKYYIHKQLQTIEFLKSKGYTLELYIHTENEKTIEDCKILYNTNIYKDIYFINNEKINYDGIIKILQNVDLCISGGGRYDMYGGSVVDMISLGKPLICLVDEPLKQKINLNELYNCHDYIIIGTESPDETNKKLIKIFNDLERSYNCYKNQLSYLDFNNWKPLVEKFLKDNKI